jgi:ribosome maturation factor RimP
MKETLPESVRMAITESCDEAGVTLIDVVIRGQARQLVLDVIIDAVDGVTHDHCRSVSRGIDERLEGDDYAGRLRTVEVSSPGAETPVKYLWQLRKHVGRSVRVKRTDATTVEGVLQRVDETGLDVQPKQTKKEPKPLISIAADEVAEAMVMIMF